MKDRIAIIGAGPGGLVAGRFLLSQGFDVTLFDNHDRPGGQWCHDNPSSGIWPMMRTNTARMLTRFSDLDYPKGTAIFPRNQQVAAYLAEYADLFGLIRRLQTDTWVTELASDPDGWRLTLTCKGHMRSEVFSRVVVASGAYNLPEIPAIAGLDGFSGSLGAIHAFQYKQPELYRGKRILIAGGNISALEIASDLAMLGASHVATAMRRQRYVMPKLIAGTPVESYGFTRAAALFQETATSDDWAASTKAFVLQYGGNPAWYGAPEPDPDVRLAKTTGSQNFLNLVAEDRIACHPWIDRIDGETVHFTDGSHHNFDAIIFGTGYRMNLPFLSEDLCRTLEVTDKSITLSERTFHPDAPGLAFMGLWGQIGPYFPTLELQARYLAYDWSGVNPPTDKATMRAGCDAARIRQDTSAYQHVQTLRFARLARLYSTEGINPDLSRLLSDTAVTALTFRLSGPDAIPDAETQIRAEARKFGRKDLTHA